MLLKLAGEKIATRGLVGVSAIAMPETPDRQGQRYGIRK
jgi:hypothetical protein